jgi:hypothetical protein
MTHRTPVSEFGGLDLRDQLWDALPPYAEEFMAPTFEEHDPEAAASLVFAAPNEYRGWIALCAYWIGLPNPAYRVIMDDVWNHDHDHLRVAAHGGSPQLRRMFNAAEFPVPLDGPVTIYRGTHGIDPVTASRGLAWTTSYEVACWFAHRFAFGEAPLVLKATVDAGDIIYYSNKRDEREVITQRPPPFAIDDGGAFAWREAADRLVRRRRSASATLRSGE